MNRSMIFLKNPIMPTCPVESELVIVILRTKDGQILEFSRFDLDPTDSKQSKLVLRSIVPHVFE